MATTTTPSGNTAMIKRIVGIVLVLLGLYVTYDGYTQDPMNTLALVLGIASILGGLAFLFIRPRHVT